MKTSLLIAGMLVASMLPDNASAAPPSSKRIIAGPVKVTDGGITGSFQVKETSAGIPSPGTGGACLVHGKQFFGGPACKIDREYPLSQSIGLPKDVAGNVLPMPDARGGWWRVHACLNQDPGACAKPESPNKMIRNGPRRFVP